MPQRLHEPRVAVSLFSNCGAGDLGYAEAGFDFRVMAELDDRRLAVAIANHPRAVGVAGDLRETWRTVVDVYRRTVGDSSPALLAACPPCQGLSTAQARRGPHEDADAGSRDERNLLVATIALVARTLKPTVVVVENVPAFLTRKVRHPRTRAITSAAMLLIRSLAADYRAFPFVADLADYGVPQTRRRVFVTFVRRRIPASLLKGLAPYPIPTHAGRHLTLRAALNDLGASPLDARSNATAGVGMHSVPIWDATRYRLVSAIAPMSGASAWQTDSCPDCGAEGIDAEATTCPDCKLPLPRPLIRGEDGSLRFIRGFRWSSYRRMYADTPAATVTTASGFLGSDRTLHPWENRVLSPLECAHLQTIPNTFDWGDAPGRFGISQIRAMIGEAVPPLFTRQHGSVLATVLRGERPTDAIPRCDHRVRHARTRLLSARRPTK